MSPSTRLVPGPSGFLPILILLGLLLAACAPRSREAADPAIATAIPLPTPTSAPPTATRSPATSTEQVPAPAESAESPTAAPTTVPTDAPSPTPSPVPPPFAVVLGDFLTLFNGPGAEYPAMVTITRGMSVDLIGRDAAGVWLYADLLLGQGGWLRADSVRVEGDIEGLAIVEAPPAPPPSPTPGAPPSILFVFAGEDRTLHLFRFRLHENVIVTVTPVEGPGVAVSLNCSVTDPVESRCSLGAIGMNPGAAYIIRAVGDQGSSAETMYSP